MCLISLPIYIIFNAGQFGQGQEKVWLAINTLLLLNPNPSLFWGKMMKPDFIWYVCPVSVMSLQVKTLRASKGELQP